MIHAELEHTRRLIALLARPGDVFELRALARHNGQQHVSAGYFDDPDMLAKCAAEQSGRFDGVYCTINPVLPSLLARAPKNKLRRAGNGDTTSDKDVLERRALLVDVDPVRPAGISSDDAEHDAALELVRRIRDDLTALGWPLPLLADSGNGGHLIYAIGLPREDGQIVKRVLAELSRRYTTATLKIDEKVYNAARITKMYGTLTRKGEDTPDRPHRLARVLEAPTERLVQVTREQLEAFAPVSPAMREFKGKLEQAGARHPAYRPAERAPFDLEAWIAEHLPDAIPMAWSSGRKWLLQVCPFDDQHDRREAFIAQKDSGSISAGCQHESCFKTWEQLRTRFEPDAYEHRNGNGNHNGNNGNNFDGRRLTHREPPPEVLFEDERYQVELDAFAARDDEPQPAESSDPWMTPTIEVAPEVPAKPVWLRGPELVAAILERARDPWVDLTLGLDQLAKVRVGATVVLIGGSGSGKSSLASCFLLEHARHIGPAIALSIELPAEELAARIVGIQCDASWEDALRGRVEREQLDAALALPRLYVLDRRRATLRNLERAIDAAAKEFPGESILVAVDYAQLLESEERDARMKVADAFAQIDDVAREKRVVVLALSQMSRVSAKTVRKGDALGAETTDLGAETAAIERWATLTMAIGLATKHEDGSTAVDLSVGKSRMGVGDSVFPMAYWGRSGKWTLAGVAKTAGEVREQRDVERTKREHDALENQLIGAASKAIAPLSQNELAGLVVGKRQAKTRAINALIESGGLVEIALKGRGSKAWKIWTADRALAAGTPLVRDSKLGGIGT